jgi:hypothetical protein
MSATEKPYRYAREKLRRKVYLMSFMASNVP